MKITIEHKMDQLGLVYECYPSYRKSDNHTIEFRGNGGYFYKMTDPMMREKVKLTMVDWLQYYKHVYNIGYNRK